MDTSLMREFTVFARYLNFSKAANNLGIAQPTLSSHIASMEMELGFSLVDRGKPMRITPAGKKFCLECERILASYDACLRECKDLSKKRAGSLIFEMPIAQGGVLDEFNYQLLLFQKQFPAIDVRKHDDIDVALSDILKSGKADVGFILNSDAGYMQEEHETTFEILPLDSGTRGPYYLWADEGHPLAKRETVDITGLDGCRFIFPSSIRYQGLEGLATVADKLLGIKVECVFWPGKYDECIMGIGPSEVMVVNADDLRDPAYSLVDHRKTILVENFEKIVKPSFVYLKSNDNPALDALRQFVEEQKR